MVLRNEALRLTVDPRHGGAIRDFQWRGRAILRPTGGSAGDDPFDMACFPLVPFVNRVAHGRFAFAGRQVRLERNWSEDPHPLHGQGWRAKWDVVAQSSSSATLSFEGGGDEWPWRYRSEQSFQLLPDELAIDLSVENLSDTPMPAMLGLHPYFPDAGRARLQARLPRVWLTDSAALPVQERATPPDWDFEPPRPVQAVPLDNSFSGWDGTASLRWPDRIVRLHAGGCEHLHVYAPAGRDFFCVEPQSAASGAFNRASADLAVVSPGARFAIRAQLLLGEP